MSDFLAPHPIDKHTIHIMPETTIDRRRDVHEQRFGRIEGKLDDIGQSLLILARIDERHVNIADNLVKVIDTQGLHASRLAAIERSIPNELDKRLGTIEQVMPGLKETRGYVMGGIVAGVGMICIAVVALVLR